jgi:tetratricopeptide (TPR) repeat protein
MTTLSKAAQNMVEKLRHALPRRPTQPESQHDDLDLRFSIAAIHYEQGQIGEAIVGLKSALAANARHADAHFLLGRIREDQDDGQAAEHEYRQAIRLEPGRLSYHLRLGAVLEKKGKTQAALKEYRIAVGLCPEDAEARFRLGAAFDGSGQLDAAIAEYQEALRIDPGLEDAAVCLAAAVKRRRALLQ